MKKIVASLLIFIFVLGILTMAGCNKQIVDLNYKYNYAIVSLMNGELVEGEISAWNDYNDSDMIQVIFTDGNIYYSHGSNILLIYDPNL